MSKYWLAGAVLALLAWGSRADPQSTWMLQTQVINSAVAQNGRAVVTIGSAYYIFDYPSRQNLSVALLRDLQQQNATIRQVTPVDPSGIAVGTFANGTLTLSDY